MTQAVRDVRREGRGNETSREASLTVRRHKVARVLVGDDRRDTDQGPGSGPPNQPIHRAHHAPTTLSVNSVVRAMGVVYVSCEFPSDTVNPHKRWFSGMADCHPGAGCRQRQATGGFFLRS